MIKKIILITLINTIIFASILILYDTHHQHGNPVQIQTVADDMREELVALADRFHNECITHNELELIRQKPSEITDKHLQMLEICRIASMSSHIEMAKLYGGGGDDYPRPIEWAQQAVAKKYDLYFSIK